MWGASVRTVECFHSGPRACGGLDPGARPTCRPAGFFSSEDLVGQSIYTSPQGRGTPSVWLRSETCPALSHLGLHHPYNLRLT